MIFKDRADYVFGMNSIPVCTLAHCVIMLTDISNSNDGIYNLMRAVSHLLGDIEYEIGKGIKIRRKSCNICKLSLSLCHGW